MDKITLTVIGCGNAFAYGGKYQSCFHVQSSVGCFLIDCGATAYSGLKMNGIGAMDIDCILISHLHGDHYGGLPFLLLEAAKAGRTDPLTIISPSGCEEKTAALLQLLYPGNEALKKLNVEFKDYRSNENMQWIFYRCRLSIPKRVYRTA